MRKNYLFLFCFLLSTLFTKAHAQTASDEDAIDKTPVKQYSGVYVMTNNPQCVATGNGIKMSGNASYQYKEVGDERVLHGKFQFTANDRTKSYIKNDSYPFMSFTISGSYQKGRRDGKWSITFKASEKSCDKSVILGSYSNGFMDGLWTYTDYGTKNPERWKVNYDKGKFSGKFSYEKVGENRIRVSGDFDENGFCDGQWFADIISNSGTPMKIVYEFSHGFMFSYKTIDQTTGKVVNTIFEKLQVMCDSAVWQNGMCVFNGRKYYLSHVRDNSLSRYPYYFVTDSCLYGWGPLLMPALLVGSGFDENKPCTYFIDPHPDGYPTW